MSVKTFKRAPVLSWGWYSRAREYILYRKNSFQVCLLCLRMMGIYSHIHGNDTTPKPPAHIAKNFQSREFLEAGETCRKCTGLGTRLNVTAISVLCKNLNWLSILFPLVHCLPPPCAPRSGWQSTCLDAEFCMVTPAVFSPHFCICADWFVNPMLTLRPSTERGVRCSGLTPGALLRLWVAALSAVIFWFL